MNIEKNSKDIDSSKSVSKISICPTHKLVHTFMHLIPDKGQILLKCAKCVIQQEIQHLNLLPIDEVKKCDDNSIFDSWPFCQDNNKFTQIFDQFVDDKQIRQFFKGFRSEVIDQIDQIEEKYIVQLQKLEENKKILIEYYNKISLKTQLKESVTNSEKDFDCSIKDIENILKNDIEKIRQDEKSNIQSIHEQFMFYYDYLSIIHMNTFKLKIKKSLNMMQNIINQEIQDILKQEESSSTFQVNQNKDYRKNKVFFCQQSFLYSQEQLQNDNQVYKYKNKFDQQLSFYHDQIRVKSLNQLKDNGII